VCVNGGTFTKQSGGVIYGSNASGILKNTAITTNGGHAVYVYQDPGSKMRDSTVGEGATLDSTKSGEAGGWVDQWTVVTFDADGGSPATQERSVTSGNSLGSARPLDPARDGYAFSGWYTQRNGGGTEFTADTPVSANTTVYAYWTIPDLSSVLSLAESLVWLDRHAEDGRSYTIAVKDNESIEPKTLSYSGKTVSITLSGETAWTVDLSADLQGSLFTVGSGVTLGLGSNITLRGRSGNTSALVRVESGGTLVMDPGSKISGNTSSSDGGGVYVDGGTFTMNGGEISGNTASNGGGVYVSGGTLAMGGGAVVAQNNDVYLSSDRYITVTGDLTGNTPVAVITPSSFSAGRTVLTGVNADSVEKFALSSEDWCIALNGTEGQLVNPAASLTNSDGTTYFATLQAAINAAPAGGSAASPASTIALLADVTLTSAITLSGKHIRLVSGKAPSATVKRGPEFTGYLFTVNSGASLTLGKGADGEELIIDGDKQTERTTDSLIRVAGGTLAMTGGVTLQNNAADRYGGGVYVYSSGTFNMSGGTISGNTATGTDGCGGVDVRNNSTFNMSGGTISGNTASNYGGGVSVYGSTFNMSGGTISNNTDGGVYVSSSGTFTMNNGTISGNIATHGGGVSVGGPFYMYGGTISGNTASNNSNIATANGGGVSANNSIFKMSGGTISGNTATGNGGGVYGSIFTKQSGGVIYGDTDTNHTEGSTENTAKGGTGHAVYVAYDGPKIRNSTADETVDLASNDTDNWE
jgi:uncharacterized repeat protein (TIGR02543 family)